MREATTPITVKSAFDSLKAAGYPRPYVERLLPDWWDNSLFKTSAGAFQFAMILKQRLGLNVQFGQDGALEIQMAAPQARYKRRSDTHEEELNIAASLGIALARLAIFCTSIPYEPPQADPLAIRALVLSESKKTFVDFEGLLDLCWFCGIPVLFLKGMPKNTKRMTGMTVNVDGRPAIILGFNTAQHSRQLFVLAHELAHILCGHLEDNGVLIDEDISGVTDTLLGSQVVRKDGEEREADAFALALLRNGHTNPVREMGRPDSAATLASSAMSVGRAHAIDPGHLILSYAKEHDDWARANQALNFMPNPIGAIELVEQKFRANTVLESLSEENQEHVLFIQGFGG